MSERKSRGPRIPYGAPGHPFPGGSGSAAPKGRGKPERAGGAGPKPRAAKRKTAAAPKRGPLVVLYEDERIVAVDKPAGLAVIAAEGSRERSLYDLVTDHLRRANPKARAALVHRIDRGTSGVVVFATSGRDKRIIMGGWDELVEERRYVALVEGRVEGAGGVLDSWIAEAGPQGMRPASAGERGALRAVTRWRLLEAGESHSLVELELETGRRHQIRLQLAGMGHPVAGDERYGARTDPLGRLCLHAQTIALREGEGGELVRVVSPCPPEFRATLGRSGPLPRRGSGPGAPPRRPPSTHRVRPRSPRGSERKGH